ncbi:MAG: LytR/AlgR family response regulator transcription factor [Thiohalomonadales bacterium]
MNSTLTAIIADDEANLRVYLGDLLGEIWPELKIIAEAANGRDAVRLIDKLEPDVAFLDINMPGLTGLDVVQKLNVDCNVVFITAYNEFAINAFELDAIDYLLKPINRGRLHKTVDRLKSHIDQGESSNPDLALLLQKFSDSITPEVGYIRWIKALDNGKVYIVPVEDVRYIKAGDKYTSVVTHEKEWLIRKSVKKLEEELNPDMFWRIHRGIIVNASCIVSAERTLDGRYELQLLNCKKSLIVSRAYGFRFKQM